MQDVRSMNRAQKAYFLESNEFADSIQDLGIGRRTPTKKYQSSIRATPLAVFNYATPREKKIKGYVGAVFLTYGDQSKGEIVTVELVCEAKSPSRKRPAEPIVRGNVVECAPNTQPLGGNTDYGIGRFVLRKDSALAHISLNYAVAGQYDQAVQVTKTIKHPHFKARALAAVAHQLGEKGQYNKALEVARTITDRSVKQIAFKAIAVQLAAKGQYDKALEVAKTITNDSVKQIALKAIALQLAEKGRYDQALQVAETIENDFVKHRALDWIARYLAVAGRYDQALQVAETIKDDSAKQSALDAIASYRKSL
jgi:predicted negative regulator of RcsB-dependent stress response